MKRFIPLAVALAAAGTLAACSAPPQTGGPASTTPNIVTNVHPYTPGSGVVQAVNPAPASSASAGGSAEPMQRLEIRMDNGTIQYVDTTSREFTKGTRVMLTPDHYIKRG